MASILCKGVTRIIVYSIKKLIRTGRAMEREENFETEEEPPSPATKMLSVTVAITGSKNSGSVIKWALESFNSEGKVLFRLLHVRAPITQVPTTLGTYPVSQVQEDVVATYKKEVERQTNAMLLPFKQMCMERKVQVYATVIEGDDIAEAIVKEIANSRITRLVIGSSSRGMFTRRVRSNSTSSRILEFAPGFCAIYVVSKGNLFTMRPSDPEVNRSAKGPGLAPPSPTSGFSSPPMMNQRVQAFPTLNLGSRSIRSTPGSTSSSNRPSLDIKEEEGILGSKYLSFLTKNGSRRTDRGSSLEDYALRIYGEVLPPEPVVTRTSDKESSAEASKNNGTKISDTWFTSQSETDNRSRSSDEEFTFPVATDTSGSSLSDKEFIVDTEIDIGSQILSGVSTLKEKEPRISGNGFSLETTTTDLRRISDQGSILEASKNNRTDVSFKGSTLHAVIDNGSREFGTTSTFEENGLRPSDGGFTSGATIDTTRLRPSDAAIDSGSRIFNKVSTLEENGSDVSSKGLAFGATSGTTTRSVLPAKEFTLEDKGLGELAIKGFTFEAATDNGSKIFDQISMLDEPSFSSSGSEADIILQLEGLGIDRKHLDTIYAIGPKETIDASSQKQNDPSKHQKEQTVKAKRVTFREDNTREFPREEKEKYDAVKQKEADYVPDAAANPDAEEKHLNKPILHSDELWNMFTWEDIVSATSSFSIDLLIGKGAFGSVYKCKLHHTTAAVKVLHSKESHWNKQFRQELEILSKIRHPHLLLLLGSCPDHGCLVYEYMEKGSLEDRLFQKDNTTPIPWFDRFRIAWEVASALVFLHNAKPKPIIHRDLKPANILLDHNYVSKIGDVGLSTLLPSDNATVFKQTSPVGTLCYIDPEYQRTGMISPKSDVYAFGMVILQLLTAKPAMALTRIVEQAIENGRLMDILDSEAGNWPVEETRELAALGLSCTELRHRDRPDLKAQILPVLERLKELAERARDSPPRAPSSPPQHFICPILQDVMDEPCVAADGYTYDRKAIDLWLKDNDNSPMTNLPLPSKNLLPNFTLLSAIMDWKSRKQ